jgi:DNA topoisomerase-1
LTSAQIAAVPLDRTDEARVHAREASLRYVTDATPGIRRLRQGDGFAYRGPDGGAVLEDDLARIKSLAIPPAWNDVWICPSPKGHLQATGRDARGRKQYRYHPAWRATRDANKFDRLIAFAQSLPKLRERVAADQRRAGLPREKVLAALVHLLETTLIRIGNEEYARDNGSYGLTTMRGEHLDVNGARLSFRFQGKGGKRHNVDVRSPRLARIVRRMRELPGQELFQYLDVDGVAGSVDSAVVNGYLRDATGGDFSAKDFRTWQATVLAAMELAALGPAETDAEAKRRVVAAVTAAAQRLGNTPAICRKSYVHPTVIEAYMEGVTARLPRNVADEDETALSAQERSVLRLLRSRAGADGAFPARKSA